MYENVKHDREWNQVGNGHDRSLQSVDMALAAMQRSHVLTAHVSLRLTSPEKINLILKTAYYKTD